MALRLMHSSVSSPFPKDLPPAIARGTGMMDNASIAKTILQFQQPFLEQFANLRHQLVRAGIVERDPHRAAAMTATILAAAALETGIVAAAKGTINAATGSKDKDDEGFTKSMLMVLSKRVPFMSQMLQVAVYQRSGIPFVDTIGEPLKEIYKAGATKTPEARLTAKIRAGESALTLAGIPGAGQAGQIAEKLFVKKHPKK